MSGFTVEDVDKADTEEDVEEEAEDEEEEEDGGRGDRVGDGDTRLSMPPSDDTGGPMSSRLRLLVMTRETAGLTEHSTT